jgi:MFS family permease
MSNNTADILLVQWDLVCDHQYIPTLFTTVLMAGVLVGAFTFGLLADTLGRKMVFYPVVALMMVSQFSIAFAPSWQVFAVIRFISGSLVGKFSLI